MIRRWVLAQEEILAKEFDSHKFILTDQRVTKREEWQRIAKQSHQWQQNSEEFFAVPVLPVKFANGVMSFPAPFASFHSENAQCFGEYFPAGNRRKAVVILGHWNSSKESYNNLANFYQRFGISALRLTLPYHDQRRPGDVPLAHGLLSADIELTINSIRQAVVEVRRAVHWLLEQGHQDIGIVGSSMGSMVGLLALCHEKKVSSFVGYLSAANFPAVVWQGSATQHIVEAFGKEMTAEQLDQVWSCINPVNYLSRLAAHRPRLHVAAARFDTICDPALTLQMVEELRRNDIPHQLYWYGCGHNTLALFPFRHLAGLRGIMFMKKT